MNTQRASFFRILAFALAAACAFGVPRLRGEDRLKPELQARAASQPNIVLILSDDQAWGDYGFMGHPAIQTPDLDKLAAESLTFRRGCVPASLCCPSLASIPPHSPTPVRVLTVSGPAGAKVNSF